VYLRDLAQLMPPVLTCLMFFSPVFYARSQAPGPLQAWLGLNPLTFVIENARRVIFEGAWPLWQGWLNYSAVAVFTYLVGFAVFTRLKKGFADVV
jgi:lipopolysaccharide transport system permease protein